MKTQPKLVAQMLKRALVAALLALAGLETAVAEGTWIPFQTNAPNGIGTMLLLSDGTVMAQFSGNPSGQNSTWYRLTPGSSGGYTNGGWSTRQTDNYTRLFYSSDVLQDGRVFVAGGEYGNGTTNAEIYDPVSDSWSIVPIPAGIIVEQNTVNTNDGANTGGFMDSGSVVLSNGKVLVLPVNPAFRGGTATYDPASGNWSTAKLKHGSDEDEASTVKLPDDSILVIDAFQQTSERYIPSLNVWTNDADVPDDLYDVVGGEEGAGFLLPNGNAFFLGSAPVTAIYTPTGNTSPGTWTNGPVIPKNLGAPDAPAAMMVNGKILCAFSVTPYVQDGTNEVFNSPTYFYEYDYSAGPVGSFTNIHAPEGGSTHPVIPNFERMLDLPDGTVLFADGSSTLYVYKPDGSPLSAGKPGINSVSWNADGSLHLTGTGFNGISQGAAFGDDVQVDSNYPLVRFIDGSGNVYYGRTYNWSSTSVQTGSRIVTTECKIPSYVYDGPGNYSLQVVANGIASDPVSFYGPVWVDFNYTGATQAGTYSQPYSTLAQGVSAVASGGTIAIKGNGTSAETPTISKPMRIVSVGGPATVGK